MEIGPYKIIQKIGEGGSGVVYRAEHNLTGQIVAIKELTKGLSAGEEMRERFIREAKILAKLTHKNIVRLYNFIEQDGLFYLIMEFMEGIRLDDVIKKETPMDYGRCIGYLKQILEGVDFAHCQGVVHRDIKPANIIVDNDGIVKIMDFGIAVENDDLRLTKTGTSLGTLRYMSPEQIKGGKVGLQSDIYSIGITLFEMITGKSPFKDDSAFHLMNAIVKNKIPSPAKFRSDVPFAIEKVIMKACAKDVSDRFGGAKEFSKALDDWDTSMPLEKTNKYTTVLPTLDKPMAMRKKRTLKIIILILLAAAVIAGTLPFLNLKSHNAKSILKPAIPARPAISVRPAISDKSANTPQPTPSVTSSDEEKESSLSDKVKKTIKNIRSPRTTKPRAKATTTSSPSPASTVVQKPSSTPIATPKATENHDEKHHKDSNEGIIDVISPKKSKD
ncbi:MAG: protein kinase [Nitrospirae bacterium]|nr:protein kinase [Nitrospirota bacterium]